MFDTHISQDGIPYLLILREDGLIVEFSSLEIGNDGQTFDLLVGIDEVSSFSAVERLIT